MARSVDEIENDIDALSAEDQRRVLDHLVTELDDRSVPAERRDDIEATWVAECARRYDALRRGEVKTIPAEQVMAEARRRLGRAG